MALPHYLENLLLRLIDGIIACIPRRRPDFDRIKNCRIVSHRGEHDNREVMENTMDAFDIVHSHGIWGIELDIRWTKDNEPVVIHDADCLRVFGSGIKVNQLTLEALQAKIPQIPSLQQVVDRFGGKLHLMIEIKEETFTDIALQRSRLSSILSNLEPGVDFHLLALNPIIFEQFDIVPNKAKLPVAELNIWPISRQAYAKDYAGISGQYLLISKRMIKKHNDSHQKTGCGFVESRLSLYRELNRGVDWIFTNHAVKLSLIRKQLLDRH